MNLNIFVKMIALNRCFLCKKFKESFIIPRPYTIRPLADMINYDYLTHLQTTHGLSPEVFFTLFENE